MKSGGGGCDRTPGNDGIRCSGGGLEGLDSGDEVSFENEGSPNVGVG